MLYLLTEPVGMTWTMHPAPHNPISISNDAFPIFHFYPPPHIPLCLGSTPSHQELTPEYKVDSIRGRLQIVILICGVSLLTSSLTSWPILTITSLDHLCSHLLHGPSTVRPRSFWFFILVVAPLSRQIYLYVSITLIRRVHRMFLRGDNRFFNRMISKSVSSDGKLHFHAPYAALVITKVIKKLFLQTLKVRL